MNEGRTKKFYCKRKRIKQFILPIIIIIILAKLN